ncbi:MAG TPA: copper resistance CopC family protein [bacterium]|nr:copper resistance CopC family protein [bacterium]
MRAASAAFSALLIALAATLPVSGHALLRRAQPGPGAILQRAPDMATLTFTEEPEPALSTIQVVDANGRVVSSGAAQPVAGDPLALSVPIRAAGHGVYTVSWRTVSRVDGHVTGGAFAFGVGVSPAAAALSPAAAAGPPPSTASILSRWIFYTGVAGLTGTAWVWTLAAPAASAAGPTWYVWLWCAAAFTGVAGIGFAQAAAAGVDIGRLLATSLGVSLLLRALPVVLAAVVLGVLRRRPGPRRWGLAAAGVCAAAAMLAHVAAGHAGATPGALRPVNIAVQWLHFLGIGCWLGGLAALLVLGARLASDQAVAAARRFSTGAGIAIVAVAATGVLRAVDNVGSWDALLSTDYGRLVMIKAALLLVLAALGAVNRYRVIPRLPARAGTLRRVGGAELAAAAIVLLLTGVLTGLAPARQTEEAVAAARPVVVTGQDFATSVRVRLEIAPGYPGANRFVLRAVDYDTGRPIAADRVSLAFRSNERPDLGTSTLDLRAAGNGVYTADGANLSLGGTWTVTALVQRATTSVDVALAVAPKFRPQTIRTIRAPGQPTLYSIDVGGGIVLDAYLDPDRPGFNELHATYISPSGQELPVPTPITIAVGRPGQPLRAVPVRRFGPGHFIGDAQLGPGAWRIEYSGTARDGTVLDARLDVTL